MRQVVAYVSLLFMVLGAIVFIGGICALLSGLRAFELPLLAIGVVVFVVASIFRWRTATSRAHPPIDERTNGHPRSE